MNLEREKGLKRIRTKAIQLLGYTGAWFAILSIYDLLFQTSGVPFRNIDYMLFIPLYDYILVVASLLIPLSLMLIYGLAKWNWRNTSAVAVVVAGLIFISPSSTFFSEYIIFMGAHIAAAGIKTETVSSKIGWFLGKLGYETNTAGGLSEQESIEDVREAYIQGEIGDKELNRRMNTALDTDDKNRVNKQEKQKLGQKEQD
jgi:hypothetical protein